MDSSQLHPLEHEWSLMLQPKAKHGQWTKAQPVASVTSVEEFWILEKSLDSPDRLEPGLSYWFFRHDISPEWEDPKNNGGGEWCYNHPPTFERSKSDDLLTKEWRNVLLYIIGENYPNGNIAGAYIQIPPTKRRGPKICIWYLNHEDEQNRFTIGRDFVTALGITDNNAVLINAPHPSKKNRQTQKSKIKVSDIKSKVKPQS